GVLTAGDIPLFVRANHKKIAETNIYAADSSFFKVFSFYFIAGNRKTALSQTNSIVLSKETAQKYFGNQNVIGHTVTIFIRRKKFTAIVKGVVKVPSNTHLQFNAVASKDAIKNLFNGLTLSQSYLSYDYV